MSGRVRLARPGVRAAADWQDAALCREVDPELFSGPENERNAKARAKREAWAKQVCGPCPVRGACLEYAFAIGDRHAVMGGLTPGERAELLRANENAAA